MASVVKICNMALSHIGAEARVSSISPPDGSVEAGHCADFYDVARTEMIELGVWRFALKRALLAETANASNTWAYAYVLPSNCLRALRILSGGVGLTVFTQDDARYNPNDRASADFEIEGDVLYTNEPEATLLYLHDVTDSAKFTPSFTSAVAYLLASYIAGPIIKGTEGAQIADTMRSKATALGNQAATASANASSVTDEFVPSSIAARR